MRNATVSLSPVQAVSAAQALDTLLAAGPQAVSFNYTNRATGEQSVKSGTVLGFHGDSTMSNGSVRMDTDKGERTYNLYLMSW